VNVVSPTRTLPAEGTICLVTADVRNQGAQARPLAATCQVLVDAAGGRHRQRTAAWRLDEFSVDAFDEPIPPGSLAENVGFYFDAPPGTEASVIELHGACGSAGVAVRL
jgi:hypothetical protein